jgi:cation:H+ antiporter
MWLSLLLLVVGFALIIKGGDLFVSSSVRIAELLRVPRVLIGSTLVSLATTAPELVVSATASFRGEPGLAIGNAVGSAICNIALIVGTVAVLRPVVVDPGEVRIPLWSMIGLGVVLSALTFDLRIGWGRGAFLLSLAVGYVAFDLYRHKRLPDPHLAEEVEALEEGLAGGSRLLRTGPGATLVFVVGAVLVVVGSRLLVDSAIVIARQVGVPPIVIGLTVVALGTSLPEYVTALTAARKGVSDLSVGNILGANILNLGLIVGLSAVIHEVEMSRVTQLYNFPVMLLVMGMLARSLLARHLARGAGGALLLVYLLYVAGLGLLAFFGYVSVTE